MIFRLGMEKGNRWVVALVVIVALILGVMIYVVFVKQDDGVAGREPLLGPISSSTINGLGCGSPNLGFTQMFEGKCYMCGTTPFGNYAWYAIGVSNPKACGSARWEQYFTN